MTMTDNGYAPDPLWATVTKLAGLIDKLPERDRSFAQSLIQAAQQYGRLSEKQLPWVDKLLAKAEAPPVAVELPGNVAQLDQVIGLLPSRDQEFARSLVSQAKQRGTLSERQLPWVDKLLERALGAKKLSARAQLLAKVAEQAGLEPRTIDRVVRRLEERLKDVTEADILAALSGERKDALVAMAKQYGDATHNCCFCGLDLTDERSTSAGYGPICAGKYGLPWGGGGATDAT